MPEGRTGHSKEAGEPRGHQGQQIHYLIWYDQEGWKNVGAISGGSAVYSTAPRDEFFHITKENRLKVLSDGTELSTLNGIIDNTLFRLELHEKNLASKIVSLWRKKVVEDWRFLYSVEPYGFETFVEESEIENGKQRNGHLYLADNWTLAGETSGSTKHHIAEE